MIRKTVILLFSIGLAFMIFAQAGLCQVGNVVVSGNQYYIDPAETDQGAAGNGKSIAAYLTAIGTSKYAELVLDHKSVSDNTTSFTVTTAIDMTTYPKIVLVFKSGAMIAGAGNLTLYSPKNVNASCTQQIFNSSGTVSFAAPGDVYPEWWGVDGTEDNVQADAAYDSLTAGGKVIFSSATYSFAANATINSNITTEIKPWTTITLAATASGTALLYALNEQNIQIIGGGTLNGNRANVTGGDYAHGIFLNTCTRVMIRDVKVTGAYKDNIYITGCTNLRVYDCNIEESRNNGIQVVSSNNIKVRGCYFDNNVNSGGSVDVLVWTGNVDVMIAECTFREGGAEIAGQGHAIYTYGSTGVTLAGNYIQDKYGWGIELQPPATNQATIVYGNHVRNCGNESDQFGGIYASGDNNLLVANFVTGSAIDAIMMDNADSNVLAGNILSNSGDSDTDGYGIRFAGSASTRTIISSNAIRDTQGTKTTKNALYLSAYPAIVLGNLLDETEDGYPYFDAGDMDHVISANLYGTRTAGAYWQGDRGRNASYIADLTGDATFDRNNFRIFLVGASGANRNLNPAGEWHSGDDVWIKNTGVSNNVVFDSSGLNQALTPGDIGYFVYNGNTSAWVKMYVGS